MAVPVAWVFVRVPNEPSEGAAMGFEVFPPAGVVVYWSGLQVTVVMDVPPTVAVIVCEAPRMSVALGVTVTVTTLADVPPPQPPNKRRLKAARPPARKLKIVRCFPPTMSPTPWGSPVLARSPGLVFRLVAVPKSFLSPIKFDPIAALNQNVRLTVKRKVVCGSK